MALGVVANVWAQDTAAQSFADMVQTITLVPPGTHDSEMLVKVTLAVDFIKRFDLPKAHLAVNEALQLDPRNAHLHFLNGFVYHLQARQGDTQKAEMALEGYQQSLRIDPGHWIAQEFLGLAYMDLKQFDKARASFSDTLLLNPESEVSIYGLMVASYLTGDAKTACAMADQFRSASAQPAHGFLRSSVAVYASCGRFKQADAMRSALAQHVGEGPELDRIDRRLAQWKTVYKKQENLAAKTRLTQTLPEGRPEVVAQAFKLQKLEPLRPLEPLAANSPVPQEVPPAAIAPIVGTQAPKTSASNNDPRMLLVDVVLLSTQELISTSKGVNLLSALSLQLGSVAGNVAAYSRVTSSMATGDSAADVSTAITRAVTIPALSYSLNIANANTPVN